MLNQQVFEWGEKTRSYMYLRVKKRSCAISELKYKRENTYNQANSLRVNHRYQFVIRPKAIKYTKYILYYLFSFCKL